MSTDDRLERLLTEVLDAGTPSSPPDRLQPETLRALRHVRRWPHWLALIKEPPMRTSSGLAVGSPTARVAIILVATLLLALTVAGAGIAGSRIFAADGTIVVAQDGSGTVTTIADAVAMAEDGETVLVRPGTYHESVTITKDITLRGDGERESVIVEVGDDSPTYAAFFYGPQSYGILLEDSAAEISNLTVRNLSVATAIVVKGGAPLIYNVFGDMPKDGVSSCCPGGSVYIHDGSTATVRDSILEGWVHLYDETPATIENNEVGWSITAEVGDAAAHIIGNTADGIYYVGSGRVEGNDISSRDVHLSDAVYHGIYVRSPAEGWTVSNNTVIGERQGIYVSSGTSGTIDGNILRDNQIALTLGGSDVSVVDNRVDGGGAGIVIIGGSPSIMGTSIGGAERGLVIGVGATPTLEGNTVCGNTTNLEVTDGAETPDTTGNEICEDTPE